jgi:hypothetical protein
MSLTAQNFRKKRKEWCFEDQQEERYKFFVF